MFNKDLFLTHIKNAPVPQELSEPLVEMKHKSDIDTIADIMGTSSVQRPLQEQALPERPRTVYADDGPLARPLYSLQPPTENQILAGKRLVKHKLGQLPQMVDPEDDEALDAVGFMTPSQQLLNKTERNRRFNKQQELIRSTYATMQGASDPEQAQAIETAMTGREPHEVRARRSSEPPKQATFKIKDIIGQNLDFLKSALKPGDGMVDSEADKNLSAELDKKGADRLKRYGEMVRRGDMSMDEFDDKYRTLSRASASRRGPEEVATVEKLFKADDAFKRNLPAEIKYEVDKREAKDAKERERIEAGRGTAAGEREIDQILSKPSASAAGESARQSAIASRQRMADQDRQMGLVSPQGDPDAFEFYSKGATPTGRTDSGEPAFTLQDRLGYFVDAKRRDQRDQRDARLQRGVAMALGEQYQDVAGRLGITDPYERFDLSRGISRARAERDRRRQMERSYFDTYGQDQDTDLPDDKIKTLRGSGAFLTRDPQTGVIRQMTGQEGLDRADLLMQGTIERMQADPDRKDRMEKMQKRFDDSRIVRQDYKQSDIGKSETQAAIDAQNRTRSQQGLPPMNFAAENRFRRRFVTSKGREIERQFDMSNWSS